MQSDQNIAEVMRRVLALDIGGSFVKAGLVSATGLTAEFAPVPVDADGDAESIVHTFAGVVRTGLSAAGGHVAGIGIAMPGPFDYARGISLMTRKFGSINGLELTGALREALPEIAEVPVRFRHDANAFLAGEMWLGAARGATRAIGVTLGTGIGVACCLDGAFINNALGSPAPEVSVWSRPYKGGIVEDFISTAGLVARYRRVCPAYAPEGGVKGISEAAKRHEPGAVRLFQELGEDLCAVLLPLCERFFPERIVFGGQIAKDFGLFGPVLQAALVRSGNPQEVVVGRLGTHAALLGATLDERRTGEG